MNHLWNDFFAFFFFFIISRERENRSFYGFSKKEVKREKLFYFYSNLDGSGIKPWFAQRFLRMHKYKEAAHIEIEPEFSFFFIPLSGVYLCWFLTRWNLLRFESSLQDLLLRISLSLSFTHSHQANFSASYTDLLQLLFFPLSQHRMLINPFNITNPSNWMKNVYGRKLLLLRTEARAE